MPRLLKTILLILLIPAVSPAQTVINVYARVTASAGNVLSISNATGTFTAGKAIIMQMQDSTLGANTSNNSSFGNLGSIQSAGLYEVVNITAAGASSITLGGAPVNGYHFNNNSRVQLITFPVLGGGGNYTLSSAVTAPAWNGFVGGVVAFSVGGSLTLSANISVQGQGFRGGAAGANAPSDLTCDPVTYFDNAGGVSTTYNGYKGEGIFNTNAVYSVARGKMLTGGGGGNANNAGGGGGGNFTAGGTGGQGWSCSTTNAGGGQGGVDLSTYITGNRFFMGGGGGGGQQNNSVGTPGANGGGIILIKANSIQTSSGCNAGAGSVAITATGITAANAGNDGAGGGGAGGSVLLQVSSYTVSNACPLKINTSGGNGGTVNNSGAHGGGAGGGKGVVILSGVVGTPANVAVTDTAGLGGGNDNTPTAVMAGSGSSTPVSGTGAIIFTPTSILPVTLQSFQANAVKTNALLQWQSATETGLGYYQVERSEDAVNFTPTGKLRAKNNNNSVYTYSDDVAVSAPAVTKMYYRLKMVDLSGSFEYSAVRLVTFTHDNADVTIKSFPNPATASVYISSGSITATMAIQVTVHDMQGRLVKMVSNATHTGANTVVVSLEGITKGQYIVTINGGNVQEHSVITKQ